MWRCARDEISIRTIYLIYFWRKKDKSGTKKYDQRSFLYTNGGIYDIMYAYILARIRPRGPPMRPGRRSRRPSAPEPCGCAHKK